MSYDRSLTRFSKDGRLFQVEYAEKAVVNENAVVAVRTKDAIIVAVEVFDQMFLQKEASAQKVCLLDSHLLCAHAGLTADARVLLSLAQIEAQSHRLTFEDPITVERAARYVAGVQLRYTQSCGVRPFGVSVLVCGFDPDGRPRIFRTEPSGSFSEWFACPIGKRNRQILEYLEKFYKEDISEREALGVAIGALREISECKPSNIEAAVLRRGSPLEFLPADEIGSIVALIDKK